MRYKVTLKSGDGTAAGWFVHHLRWEGPDAPDPAIYPISNWTEDDGVFAAEIDLEPGTYGLVCHLNMSGRKVEISMAPAPTITQPRGQQWPFKVEVPATRSQFTGTRYFKVEG